MFSNIFLDNTSLRGKIKILYYSVRSLMAWRKWRVCYGSCNVCGEKTWFYFYSVGFEKFGVDADDETGFCLSCGAQNRNRALAMVLQKEYFSNTEMPLHKSSANSGQRIYIAAANGAVYTSLRRCNDLYFSEYFEDVVPGEYNRGIQCQDLTSLSFDDSSIDLIISEHVLEHVRDPLAAFSEMHRVLKPGGYAIFSIPFEADDVSVVRITPDMHEKVERKYHKDPLRNEGALVFTDFACRDFVNSFLLPYGFDGEVRVVKSIKHCILESYVVVVRKTLITSDAKEV